MTSSSEPEKPLPVDVRAVGEQRQDARRPELGEAGERPSGSPSSGVWSILKSPVWITTPRGVSIASATQSGMLCVTRRNSMRERADRDALARADAPQPRRASRHRRAPRASARRARASARCRRPGHRSTAARAGPRRCDPRDRASARAPRSGTAAAAARSGMTRSTPRSSGSGNITPASTRMAVSPQATTIMFMPNSPTPAERDQLERRTSSRHVSTSAVVRMRPQFATCTSKGRSRTKSCPWPGSIGRDGGGSHRCSCRPRTAAGTAPPRDGRRSGRETIAQTRRQPEAKTSASRASSVSCSVSGRRRRVDAGAPAARRRRIGPGARANG